MLLLTNEYKYIMVNPNNKQTINHHSFRQFKLFTLFPGGMYKC